MKITRSTTCSDLGLEEVVKYDGCVRRGSHSEDEKKLRQYQCKRYFSDRYNIREIGKRGKTIGQRAYERAWADGDKIQLTGQGSDAGGGGVGKRLYVSLKTKDRTKEYYLIATCSLHGWQRVLGNAIDAGSGGGGMFKRDVLQMLHTVYQIQGEYEIDKLKGMWSLVSGKAYKTMPKPNIGRWGSFPHPVCGRRSQRFEALCFDKTK
jgi:hypothetical protein